MIRLIIILLFATHVDLEVQSVQYQMHVSRKSRSNTAPSASGYVYEKVGDKPATMVSFGQANDSLITYVKPHSLDSVKYEPQKQSVRYKNNKNKDKLSYVSVADKYNNIQSPKVYDKIKTLDSPGVTYDELLKTDATSKPLMIKLDKMDYHKYSDKAKGYSSEQDYHPIEPRIQAIQPGISEIEANYVIAKAKAKQDSMFFPWQVKSNIMFDKLKSLMHYRPPAEEYTDDNFNSFNNFHVDDDDIRTSSRSSHDFWPYYYNTPYEYEQNKLSSDLQKAKDKRFAVDKIIPVHEHHEFEPNVYHHATPQTTTAENPFLGHQPFFSFVLRDYFNKDDSEEDPLIFKGLDDVVYYDTKVQSSSEDYAGKNPRLPDNYYPAMDYDSVKDDSMNNIQGESVTEQIYGNVQQYDSLDKGDDYISNEALNHDHKRNTYTGFKDFVDTFANKFGSEGHDQNSQYALRRNQDKGEKRKGFRRVYHKDEYKEDNEFYDNNNISAQSDERGGSSVKSGGSEAYLKSHAAAALGNESTGYKRGGNSKRNNFQNHRNGYDNAQGLNRDFNRYRDVAKRTALSNSADYVEH